MGTWEHLANFLGNKGDQRTSFGGIGEHSAFLFVGSIQKAFLGTRVGLFREHGNTNPPGGPQFCQNVRYPN